MTLPLIMTICALILIAYLFDITSRHTKVPTVIFLLLLGWGMKQLADLLELNMANLAPLLPVFGTLGLILIVLEGGLELQVNREKLGLVRRSVLWAAVPLLLLALLLAAGLQYISGGSFLDALLNVVPLCVISSAIAIPSVQNLSATTREKVIYESSMSDIVGVLLFGFLANNQVIGMGSFLHFGLELLVMLSVSLLASIGLAFLIKKIRHHVKLVPIMIMVVLVYAIAKAYHLPALLFILIFGLFLNNLDELRGIRFIRYLQPKLLDLEVQRFARLVGEAAFLIRTIFFILFGYTLRAADLIDLNSLPYALGVVVLIFIVRAIQLKLTGERLRPMLFIAPRGLITLMLFLSIPQARALALVGEGMVLQVVVLSIIILMIGLVFFSERPANEADQGD